MQLQHVLFENPNEKAECFTEHEVLRVQTTFLLNGEFGYRLTIQKRDASEPWLLVENAELSHIFACLSMVGMSEDAQWR